MNEDDIAKQKRQACFEYAEKFSDKVCAKEMVELYEFFLLKKAYEYAKDEIADLKNQLAKKNDSTP